MSVLVESRRLTERFDAVALTRTRRAKMIRQSKLLLTVATLAFTAGACSDPSGPGGSTSLTTDEVRSLALGVSGLASTDTDATMWEGASFAGQPSLDLSGSDAGASASTGPFGFGIWGHRGLGVHGTSTTTIERSAPCPQGGTMNRSKTITAVVDTVAKSGTVSTTSTDTPEACAFAVDSMNAVLTTIADPGTVITISGAPSIVSSSETTFSWSGGVVGAMRGGFRRSPAEGTHTGAFTFKTSDGRSGTCEVDLTTSFDAETHTHSVTGTFCGEAIDISRTLRRRFAGQQR